MNTFYKRKTDTLSTVQSDFDSGIIILDVDGKYMAGKQASRFDYEEVPDKWEVCTPEESYVTPEFNTFLEDKILI